MFRIQISQLHLDGKFWQIPANQTNNNRLLVLYCSG